MTDESERERVARIIRERVYVGHDHVPNADEVADAILASLPARTAVEVPEEKGWLIQRGGQWYAAAPHTDWTIKHAVADLYSENWTRDANKALRFARRVDAETLIRFFGLQHSAATEHLWLDSAPSPPNGETK